jgi:hypothetical protein
MSCFYYCLILKEEKSVIKNIEFEWIAELHHGSAVTDISWSSETDLLSVPRVLK